MNRDDGEGEEATFRWFNAISLFVQPQICAVAFFVAWWWLLLLFFVIAVGLDMSRLRIRWSFCLYMLCLYQISYVPFEVRLLFIFIHCWRLSSDFLFGLLTTTTKGRERSTHIRVKFYSYDHQQQQQIIRGISCSVCAGVFFYCIFKKHHINFNLEEI